MERTKSGQRVHGVFLHCDVALVLLGRQRTSLKKLIEQPAKGVTRNEEVHPRSSIDRFYVLGSKRERGCEIYVVNEMNSGTSAAR